MKLTVFLSILLIAFPVWAEYSGSSGIQKEILKQSDSSWDGSKLPAYPDEPPFISIVKFVVPPKAQLPWHEHPMINAGVLISGELTVVKEDGSQNHLKAGDGIIELVDTWHYGRNDGEVPAEIIVVYVGVKGQPLAILKENGQD